MCIPSTQQLLIKFFAFDKFYTESGTKTNQYLSCCV